MSSCDERVIPQSKRPGKSLDTGDFYPVTGSGLPVGLVLRNDTFPGLKRQVKVIKFRDFRPPVNLPVDGIPNSCDFWLPVSSMVDGCCKKFASERFHHGGEDGQNI